MKKRILSALLCLVLMLTLTAQIIPAAKAEIYEYDTMKSPISLEAGKTYKRMTMLRYERVGYDYSATIEGTVPGMTLSTEIMDAIYISAFYYLEGTPTQPGTYPVTLWLRDASGNVIMEQHYQIVVTGDIPVSSVNLELTGYAAGASVSGAKVQIRTEGVEFAVQGAANGFVFQDKDSRTADPITSGTFQENTDYYVMVILDIKSGYLRNYDTDNITLTVNGQTAAKAKGGMNNIAGNDGESKLLIRFKLPNTGHAHTTGSWQTDGTNHWKICSICGEKTDFAAHSGGDRTCRYKAQCDFCEAFYGDFADHEWSAAWDFSNATGHSHTCQTPGCGELSTMVPHNPGTDSICKDCGYTVTAVPEKLSPLYVFYHNAEGLEVVLLKATDGRRDITVYLDELALSVSGGLVHFVTYTDPLTTGEGLVTFTSSNPDICSRFSYQKQYYDGADEVLVLFSCAGTTTITAQLPNGAKQSVTVTVKNTRGYTVSFDPDGGSGAMKSVEVTSSAYMLPQCDFTAPEGKMFDGWLYDGERRQPGDTVTLQGDTNTLKAIWVDLPIDHICESEKVEKVAPTETEAGKEAYYICTGCGNAYEDEEGSKLIEDLENWGIIAPTGQSEEDGKDASKGTDKHSKDKNDKQNAAEQSGGVSIILIVVCALAVLCVAAGVVLAVVLTKHKKNS